MGPRGVAPERMPEADATGLAPKKSADHQPSRTRFVGCGRVWLPFRPRQRSSFRQAALYRTHENQSISLVKPRSGGLGLQNAKTARPLLPGAPNGFFLSGYRPCLHGGVSYPTCNPLRHHRSLVRLKRNLRNQPGNTLRTSMGKIVTRYNTGDRHCAYHPVGR